MLRSPFVTLLVTWLCLTLGAAAEVSSTPRPDRIATYLVSAHRHSEGGSLSVFEVDTDKGDLTLVASCATAEAANVVAAHPTRPFLYAGLDGPGRLVDGFAINPASGELTRLPGFPIASEPEPDVFMDRSGSYLYAASDTTIDGFRIDQASGALTRLPRFPLNVPGMLAAITGTFNLDNSLFALTDQTGSQVFVFAFDPGTGALQLLGQTPTSKGPTAISFDPLDRFLLVSGQSGMLESFSVSDTGSLVPLARQSFALPGALSYQMAFYVNVVYVSDGMTRTINAYEIGPDGRLSQLPGFPVGGGGSSVIRYPSPFPSQLLYASDSKNHQLNGFRTESAGNLSPLPGSPFPAPDGPAALTPVIVDEAQNAARNASSKLTRPSAVFNLASASCRQVSQALKLRSSPLAISSGACRRPSASP